jgi:hypothetical protein
MTDLTEESLEQACKDLIKDGRRISFRPTHVIVNVTIVSMPHSGTRFVESFFLHCGLKVSRRHVGEWPKNWPGDGLRVIPVRDREKIWASTKRLQPQVSRKRFIELWEELESLEGYRFPIEVPNVEVLSGALDYVGLPHDRMDGFVWKPVNVSNR